VKNEPEKREATIDTNFTVALFGEASTMGLGCAIFASSVVVWAYTNRMGETAFNSCVAHLKEFNDRCAKQEGRTNHE